MEKEHSKSIAENDAEKARCDTAVTKHEEDSKSLASKIS